MSTRVSGRRSRVSSPKLSASRREGHSIRIAIVTFEFEGLTRNGGIGTAYARLARLLVTEGHEVTVVFLPVEIKDGKARSSSRYKSKIQSLRQDGISVVIPREAKVRFEPGQIGYFLGRSQLVYEYLRTRAPDLVHAPDNCALVYLSLLARKAGTDFQSTTFVIGAHGPRIWGDELNGEVTLPSRLMSSLDRATVELADRLVSPSRYMVGHLKARGWVLPLDSQVIPNPNGLGDARKASGPIDSAGSRPKAIVFFGRLEVRKGVYLFAEAVQRLLKNDPKLGSSRPLELLFLGKDPDPSGKTIARLRQVFAPAGRRLALRLESSLSSEESLKLLRKMGPALVCMPSVVDNSPYVLVEAIENGLDLLATRSGGQAELILPADRSRALCNPDVESLHRAIRKRLFDAPIRVRPSRDAKEANRKWRRFHSKGVVRACTPRPGGGSRPLVSIVVRSARALSSVLKQDYPNLELMPISSLGVACSVARGKYLLFLKDPLASPSALTEWIRAAEASGREGHTAVATFAKAVTASKGTTILKLALWDRIWLEKECAIRNFDPLDENSLEQLCISLVLSERKLAFHPSIAVQINQLHDS